VCGLLKSVHLRQNPGWTALATRSLSSARGLEAWQVVVTDIATMNLPVISHPMSQVGERPTFSVQGLSQLPRHSYSRQGAPSFVHSSFPQLADQRKGHSKKLNSLTGWFTVLLSTSRIHLTNIMLLNLFIKTLSFMNKIIKSDLITLIFV